METVFTEVTNVGGPINKVLDEDGNKQAQANVTYATGRTVKMELKDVGKYLESLNEEKSKALILGISGLDEFRIKRKGKEDLEKNIISRSSEHFKYVNSDSVGLMLFDIDEGSDHGAWSESEADEFIDSLELLLDGCLIGAEGSSRKTLCRFVKDSSSAGVLRNGQAMGSGIHVYFPVRNPNEKLIDLIYKWAWLAKWKSHLVDKAGGVHIRTIIDRAVRSPERLVFESDVSLPAVGSKFELMARKCHYIPGGVLDSELAIAVLEEEIGSDFEVYSSRYLEALKKTPEVVKVRKEYDAARIADLMERGATKIAAKKAVRGRRQGSLLSSDFIVQDDGTEVSVYDILVDREAWDGATGFRPPMEPEYGKGKCKIFVNEGGVVLNSMAHGGEVFHLRFDAKGIKDWMRDAASEDVEELAAEYIATSDLTPVQRGKLIKEAAKYVGATKKDLEDEIKEIEEDVSEATEGEAGLGDTEAYETQVKDDATHIMIAEAALARFKGDYMVFGENLMLFDKTIWRTKSPGNLKTLIGHAYGHCNLCNTASHYNQLMKLLLETAPNRVSVWKSADGFPCSNSFWEVTDDGVAPVEYKKSHGCRYKIGFEPDFEMKTPYWDRLLKNVVNVECFQRVFGLALAGSLTKVAQQVGVFKGPGGCGKGTITKVLKAMLPANRVSSVSVQEMNVRGQVWQLKNSAINLIPEITSQKGRVIDLTGFKAVIGGDDITGEEKWVNSYTFISTTPHILSFNQWPNISAFGSEVSRRMADTIVEFQHNHDETIQLMDEKIIEYELPGVLAFAIKGVELWLKDKNVKDAHSREMFRQWSYSIDSVVSFTEDRCVVHKKAKVLKQGLYDEYKFYCKESSLEGLSRTEFYAKVGEAYEETRRKDGRYFSGIELNVRGD